jgi:hypothetical protein
MYALNVGCSGLNLDPSSNSNLSFELEGKRYKEEENEVPERYREIERERRAFSTSTFFFLIFLSTILYLM